MPATTEDRAALRAMILNCGYHPSAAAYELSTRSGGATRAELQAEAAEVKGQFRPSFGARSRKSQAA